MKKYNIWLNEEAQAQTPVQKTYKTDKNNEMNFSDILDMIGYSIKNTEKTGTSNNIVIGNYYLYTNMKGETYPVRVLSLDHTMQSSNTKAFTPGKGETDKKLNPDNTTVQYTNTKSEHGRIGDIESESIAILTSKLKPIQDDHKWNDAALKDLISQYQNSKSDKIKNMLSLYIKNHLKQLKFEDLKKINDNATFTAFSDYIKELLNKKSQKNVKTQTQQNTQDNVSSQKIVNTQQTTQDNSQHTQKT